MDWRDAAAYDYYTKNHDNLSWAWEFLRRNPEYKADWEAALAEWLNHNPKADAEQINAPDFFLPLSDAAMVEKWGLLQMLNPDNAQPINLAARWNTSWPIRCFVGGMVYEKDTYTFTLTPEGKDYTIDTGLSEETLLRATRPRVDDGEIAIIFNLEQSIDKQLEQARRVLNEWKKDEQHRNPRLSPEMFRIYLRALDARQAGASLKEILACLKKEGVNSEQGAGNILRRGKKLASKGYRKLVRMGRTD